MSGNMIPSMEALPVELLHRIFDNLDAQTIVVSIRSVCRLFHSIVNTYNRYALDFNLISKSSFHVLCRLIHPHNVISLRLSNDERTSNQIDLFISLLRLRQFTRLQSLTLLDIDEGQLDFMLKRVNLNSLTSFSFSIRKYDDRRIKTTNNLLSSITNQSSLRRLELNITAERMSSISWPINCTLQYLMISQGIPMDNLLTIFQCSPNLRTVIMKQSLDESINNMTLTFPLPMCFRQLTSLTIEQLDVNIDKLEKLLSLTPSLVYLKLISENEKISDGKRWEQFIETNLPQLDKFEFFFKEMKLNRQTREDLEIIIASFQTPFWMEHKKWFVTCEYVIDYSRSVYLYSIPICKSHFFYEPKLRKVSLSTYIMTTHDDLSTTNNVDSLGFVLSKSTKDNVQKTLSSHPLFPKVTKIDMNLYREWQLLSLQSISTLINISQIVEIKMHSICFNDYTQNTLMNIGIFIEQAKNLSSLIIQSNRYQYRLGQTIKNIHSIIPRHVKHLHIPINAANQIKRMLKRCQYLSTLKLDLIYSKSFEEVIKWCDDNTINSTCLKGYQTATIWLGTKTSRSTEIKVDHKRIKLTEDS